MTAEKSGTSKAFVLIIAVLLSGVGAGLAELPSTHIAESPAVIDPPSSESAGPCIGVGVRLEEAHGELYLTSATDCTGHAPLPNDEVSAEASATPSEWSENTSGLVETVFTHNVWGASFVLGEDGSIFISDQSVDQILRYEPATGQLEHIAGTGQRGFSGDGGPAVDAELAAPSGLAFGPDGRLYFADQLNHRVRVVDLDTGVIDTIVGVGPVNTLSGGFSGDGGPASAAELSRTGSVAFDANGNLFIADVANHRIRRVDAESETISTFAGSGPVGFGNGSSTGDGGLASDATLDRPQRVAFTSAGDVIVVESASERWRIVDLESGIISRFAGTGIGGFAGDGGPATDAWLAAPTGIAVDEVDNVFMADQLNCRIRRIDSVDGVIDTIGGNGACATTGDGGLALLAQFDRPAQLALNPDGDLFIAGRVPGGHGIRVIAGVGEVLSDPGDEDEDGIADGEDYCPGTQIPESVPTNQLGVNRWALVDGDQEFDTMHPPGGGVGPDFQFSVSDTRGCSCGQIIDALSVGWGHESFGCSTGLMLQWQAMVWSGQGDAPASYSAQFSRIQRARLRSR